MFCSKCGEKVEAKDKFCPKCGNLIGDVPGDNKDKDIKPVAPPAKNTGCLSCLLIFLIIISFLALSGTTAYFFTGNKTKNATELVLGITLLCLAIFILGIWALVKQNKKNLKMKESNKKEENSAAEMSPPAAKKQTAASGCAVAAMFIILVVVFFVFIWPYIHHTVTNVTTDLPGGPISNNWDGYYQTTMQKPNCDSSVELTAFYVTGGEVQNPWGGNAKIDSNGKAAETLSAGSTPTVVNMTFSGSKVSGTWSSGRCSGTFQGSKS
ncbi:MAG: zinc ribbon domain-containing protein [Patescibacteria group bacterium]